MELGARHARGREADAGAVDEGARGAVLERYAADDGVREHEARARVAIRAIEPAPVEPDVPGRGARGARVESLQPRERDARGQVVGGRCAGRESSLQRGLAEWRAHLATQAMRSAVAAEGELAARLGARQPWQQRAGVEPGKGEPRRIGDGTGGGIEHRARVQAAAATQIGMGRDGERLPRPPHPHPRAEIGRERAPRRQRTHVGRGERCQGEVGVDGVRAVELGLGVEPAPPAREVEGAEARGAAKSGGHTPCRRDRRQREPARDEADRRHLELRPASLEAAARGERERGRGEAPGRLPVEEGDRHPPACDLEVVDHDR